MRKSIGIKVKKPKQTCEDKKCPFHGEIGLRGRIVEGKIESAKVHKSVTVVREWQYNIPKYERFARKRSKLHAHNPQCIGAKEGDIVRIMETRPLSKTKHFVVIEKVRSGVIETSAADEVSSLKKTVKTEEKKDDTKSEKASQSKKPAKEESKE